MYGEQENTLFVVIGVPETTHFEPLVRKEISEIKFHKLSALSGKGRLKKEPKHIMIEPTIADLKKWLKTDLGQSMRKAAMYNDFDIMLGPFPAYRWRFTALHAPYDVSYLVAMVVGC